MLNAAQKQILESLEPLFQRANEQKLWFSTSYQGIMMSPKELRKAHSEGRFIWGRASWTLVPPPPPRDEEQYLAQMRAENKRLKERIDAGWE